VFEPMADGVVVALV